MNDRSTNRRWRPRRMLIVLSILAVFYVAYRLTLHFMVEAKLNEIRKQGYPVTLAELDKWYPQVPAAENAADVYTEAFKAFTTKQPSDTNLPVVGDVKLPPRGVPMPEGLVQAVSEYLTRNKEALALLHRAARFPVCRYPVDLTQGSATRLPHLTNVRQGVRVLLLEARLYSERGRADQAAQSILSSLALARSLSAEPTEISQLARLTCYRTAATHLEGLLNRVSLPDDSLIELAKRFSELEATTALVRGCVGERCCVIDFSKHPAERISSILEDKSPPPALKSKILFLRVSGLFDVFLLHDLEAMERFLKVCSMLFPEGVKQTKDADPPFLFTQVFLINGISRLGNGRTIVQLAALNTAQVTASVASLAIERHRLSNGKLPDSLDELVPALLAAVPTDPFDGQPLRYKKLAKGYVVYSIGENGKDDGGGDNTISARTNWKPLDITFTVER